MDLPKALDICARDGIQFDIAFLSTLLTTAMIYIRPVSASSPAAAC